MNLDWVQGKRLHREFGGRDARTRVCIPALVSWPSVLVLRSGVLSSEELLAALSAHALIYFTVTTEKQKGSEPSEGRGGTVSWGEFSTTGGSLAHPTLSPKWGKKSEPCLSTS